LQIFKPPQTFNDGIVSIYDLTDNTLTLKHSLRYHERTVGLSRHYIAKQSQVKVVYVLRCPRLRDVSAQDIAIPNDGKQYRIEQIQYPEDINPPVMDLTLEELTAYYDIYQPAETEGSDEP
jgi:hypothetical protein